MDSTARIWQTEGLGVIRAVAASAVALALFGLAMGQDGRASWLAPVERAAAAQVRLAVGPATSERQLILDLIRDHRARASESFHHRLADAIYGESLAAEVDPLMVAAIVAAESSFRPRVVSSAGAIGLMQLRPFVAEDVAQRRNVAWTGPETLESPEVNVRLGILYFQELEERFGGDRLLALTAYNHGPTRVVERLRSGELSGSSRYAERVMAFYTHLKSRGSVGA